MIGQNHSRKGYEGINNNLASNLKFLFEREKFGVSINYKYDGFNGNYESEGKFILSPYSSEYLEEISDVKRRQSLYEIRNNDNYLKGISPNAIYIPLIIPKGIELTAAFGDNYDEQYAKFSLGAYLYRNFGINLGYEFTKKDKKTTIALKKAF